MIICIVGVVQVIWTYKIVTGDKSKTYESLYKKVETREGEKDINKLTKMRERKTRSIISDY